MTCGAIAYPGYTPQTWHTYLTLLALLVVQGLITMQSTKFIGWVNKVRSFAQIQELEIDLASQVGTVANVVIILIFVIWFPVGSINRPKNNKSSEIWTTFENGTEWPIGWATIM